MVHRRVALGCLLLAFDVSLAAERVNYLRDVKPILMPENPRNHWAFRPPVKSPVPTRGDPDWQANPIDAFLAAAYQRQGLKATPPASKDLWLRRVSVDLIGLPPTHEELRTFRADDSPGACERVVDRLLASQQYGIRWGRHWMDIWRYSDWFGLGAELRSSHPHLWRWRDWIVESLNADKGYDQMIIEMLAGDELAPTDPDTLRATGFLARNWYIFNRNVILDQTLEHTSRGFLGLTLQCARCHDHKFDPIAQTEYYQLRAFFEPQHVRIDRVPGEPDRTKAGLARAYDAFLDTPTYLFERGDEEQPRTNKSLAPAVPAIFPGSSPVIQPIALPRAAQCPDQRDFVVQEILTMAASETRQARTNLTTAGLNLVKTAEALSAAIELDRPTEGRLAGLSDKPNELKPAQTAAAKVAEDLAKARQAATAAPGEFQLAKLRVARTEAKQAALEAVIRVEKIENEGAGSNNSHLWQEAALETSAAQSRFAVQEARENQLSARQASDQAQRNLEGLTLASSNQSTNQALQAAAQKSALDLVEARSRLAKAEVQLASVEAAELKPATTNYSRRPFAYPRAATRYNETPPNEPYPQTSSGRRLALARWIADRNNPLTARVAVNHIWARHFGEPLVTPVFDFGFRTKAPVHRELLDWLAVDFMESGWNMKRLHRLILLSQAYRMRSLGEVGTEANAKIDPDNRYFWRMNSARMEGEVIRDSLLYLSGKLDTRQGGPELPVAAAEEGYRRTIYYRYTRDDQLRFLTMFDAPSIQECYRRHETIVPQQALVMANSKMVLSRAQDIAAVINREEGSPEARPAPAAFVTSAFDRVLGRPPAAGELAECQETLATLTKIFTEERDPAPETRARASLVHVLLNHNDFISRR